MEMLMRSISIPIINLINIGITRMALGEKKELSKIIDEASWEAIPIGERLALGRIFKTSVLSGIFPQLRLVETRGDNHKIYQKI